LIGDGEETINITVNASKGQILFRLKDAELVSQLIQGSFPQYNQLIPESHSTRVEVDVAEFLRAARTASIFARDGSGIVRLEVLPEAESPVRLKISARSEEIGDNECRIDARVEGAEAKIAFNGKYLIEVLSVLRESRAYLETTSPSSPGVVRPVGADNYVHVIMPMFVQW
ncbi:MAG: DNA polymerase III subunit beta, partial [Chloroflexi bacterium]|nr:DNA polymerase III subunit beta [Chloroflexota bacterium]